MDKGDILYSPNHQFDDSSISNKLLILLNKPQTDNTFIVALVTSKQKRRKDTPGCHHDSSESYYVIDKNTDWFRENKTWVLFSTLKMLSSDEVNQEIENGNLATKSTLKTSTLNAVVNCLKNSPDISGFMIDIINK